MALRRVVARPAQLIFRRRALTEVLEHDDAEHNHHGKGNLLLFPSTATRQAALGTAVRGR